ncbi:MAG: [Fe-Fe] hydrogenase large subunit C-terminal domain-containing protein [Candidatus Sumerlaeota bacterium]
MDEQYPIYTARTECQDCFKCIRHCPVKAIKMREGHAAVLPELCVACGTCVEVCPAGAKRVRSDVNRARRLLGGDHPVYASLAPSWVSEFPGADGRNIIAALQRLGFAGVGETALGAQEVSAAAAEELAGMQGGLLLSSACPSAVEFVRKYRPEQTGHITRMLSPALTHARMLRREFGQEIGVVFIGPCIAKKLEADRHAETINLSLTFAELHEWLELEGIDPETLEAGVEDFVLAPVEEGAVYPVEGGMIETIRRNEILSEKAVHFLTVAGVAGMDRMLGRTTGDPANGCPVFVELLSCEGGCVNGPCATCGRMSLEANLSVMNRVRLAPGIRRQAGIDLAEEFTPEAVEAQDYAPEAVAGALRSIGKTQPEDELNCGGCGYETCRNFAMALLSGRAEPTMCLSWLRRNAQRKANALLRCMPSSVVIVDRDLQIIECNQPFAELSGEDTLSAFEAAPGLNGAALEKIIPFAALFRQVLNTGAEIQRQNYSFGKRLLNITIFNIDPGQVVGAVIQDVTRFEMRRKQIAQQAREVIDKNMMTVQEIARQLGENMADTEILLRSIAEGYGNSQSGGEEG